MSILLKRCERLISIAVANEIDAFAVVPGANFTYLTGVELHLMERPTVFIVRKDGSKLAIMPSLEEQKWSRALPMDVVQMRKAWEQAYLSTPHGEPVVLG